MSQEGFSLKFRRPSSKLHKDPPSFSSRILRTHQSTTSLKRHPSAPVYPRSSPNGSREHVRSRSNASAAFGSSSSSLDHSGGPSPVQDEGSFFSGYSSSRSRTRSNRFSYDQQSSDELNTPFETRGMLSALDENSAETDIHPQQQPPSLPSHHTSPDPRGRQTLRQSASFTALPNRMDPFAHRETERPPHSKRYSDEANIANGPPGPTPTAAKRQSKKASFSSFVNSMLGSPRNIKISAPENPVHVTHVGYDNQTGQFTGLPKEWQRLLQENGISKKEQEEHPQTMMDIMRFYEKNTRGDDDEVWHKFDNAYSGNNNSSNGNNNNGRSASPPGSPRFPQNHEWSFENPRAPPPIPRGAPANQPQQQVPTMSPPLGGMVPHRAPPKPPTSMTPVRPPPQPPVSQSYGGAPQRPIQDPYTHPFGTPPIPESEPLPSSSPQLSRSSSRNGGPPTKGPSIISNPTQYQQQQEQVMAAAQQAIASKHLDRSTSQRQQPQQPPALATNVGPSTADPASAGASPSTRAPPAARPRQRQRQSNIMDVRARLLSICHPGDPTQIYHSLNKIGQGASGGVFTAYETGTNNCVAIKQMNLDLQPKKDLIINEILVMKDSKHKNIVNFLESYLNGIDLWVVMEYMEGGSLTDVVTFNIMSEGQIAAVCREVSFTVFRKSPPRIFSLIITQDTQRITTSSLQGCHSPRHQVRQHSTFYGR